MQLGGIGSGHGADTHQVTNCIHTHTHSDKSGGAMQAGQVMAQASQAMAQAETQDAQFTLTGWLEKTLGSGKRLLGSLWGSDAGTAGQSDGRTGAEQTLAQINEAVVTDGAGRSLTGQENRLPDDPQSVAGGLHTPQIAAAASTVRFQELRDNPYFSAVEKSDGQQGSLLQRVKGKLKSMREQLAEHLPGRFSNAQTKGSFQSRKENHREDLRRRSKFRKDELEIDCVLTDDSYLLDSYDRKGGYSKLSAEK